ncbi:MAG TPA: hypothetical protein VJN21_00425 [Candidatus Acidoferrales bacterium]|nr:hypothetical protein [Candidatus Acidoferrales bacterium]
MRDAPIHAAATAAAAPSALNRTRQFLRDRWAVVLAISAAVVVPCLWQRHIQGGDYASHIYNAWLAHLIRQGRAPGLYIVRQWNNILVDTALDRLSSLLGFAAAEKIVACVCVLVFFWGAFALLSAATRRAPWFLAPALAMVAYGWTFQLGFMNYYLAIGLACFALAITWRARGIEWLLVALIALIVLVAHPMVFVWLVGAACYVKISERLPNAVHWLLFAAALGSVYAVRVFILRLFESDTFETATFYLFNGADQLVTYGARYVDLQYAVLAFGALCMISGIIGGWKHADSRWAFRVPLELWAVLVFAAAMLPENFFLPEYTSPAGLVLMRLTSITAILGLCVLGSVKPRWWHLAGFAVCAAFFFTWTFEDTLALNHMERQAENLVGTLPFGTRVTETIWNPEDSRVYFIMHIVDRACIGHCFSFANYEPSSEAFRIRVRRRSPVVTDDQGASDEMERGVYVVKPQDLPMMQIYQCDERDPTKLCIRPLVAGEKTNRTGFTPSWEQ